MKKKLLLIGPSGGTHLAGSLLQASQVFSDHLTAQLTDTQIAYEAPKWYRYVNWHLLGKRPPRLKFFNYRVTQTCTEFQPDYLIATGLSPLQSQTLQEIRELGIRTINFLTDDPWNPAHRAKWFLNALPHYNTVFSPRRVIMDELSQIGCQDVRYLPFAYDPHLFYPISPTAEECKVHSSDVMFAGGGDRDRVPYISALIDAGMNLGLYGGYWERYAETKLHNRGIADIATMRLAIHSTKIALCLVRKGNRDGHVMRTFEVPAVGACMLTEDTPDHREIFGKEGEAVVYFQTITEMVEKARWLLDRPDERQRLSLAAHKRIVEGHHTYSDRLTSILEEVLNRES
jgi:spore maturation protein CgeB